MGNFKGSLALIGLVALASALAGCSDEVVHHIGGPPTSDGSSHFGLQALVTQAGKTKLVRVVPADLRPGPPKKPNRFVHGAPKSPQRDMRLDRSDLKPAGLPGVHELATVGRPDGSSVDTTEEDVLEGTATGGTLLYWALTACANEQPSSDADAMGTNAFYYPGTIYGSYFFYSAAPVSCDQGLFQQELLLCAANKLAQVSDSVGTVTWFSQSSPNTPAGDSLPIQVTIPPQSAEDRFVARDVAITALAHLARTQLVTPPGSWSGKTCVDGYALEAKEGSDDEQPLHPPFLTHFAPFTNEDPFSLTQDRVKQLGAARLKQQAAISAAAVGLLQELVERSFAEDVSGAEKLKAAAADPARGIAAFWGAPTSDANTQPYNTMRHALRLLYGRLEQDAQRADAESSHKPAPWQPWSTAWSVPELGAGPMDRDPACARSVQGLVAQGFNYRAIEIMDALGGGFENRFNDIPPSSVAQEHAISMIEHAGILLPHFFDDSQVSPADFRDATTNQLLRTAALEAGIGGGTSYTQFINTDPIAQSVKDIMRSENLSDAQLRFALDRVYGLFLLAARTTSNIPEDQLDRERGFETGLDTAARVAGLSLLPAAETPEVTHLGGAVVDNGLPRRALQSDVMALMGGAQIASDCGYDAPADDDDTESFAKHATGQAAAFQDVFSLSEVMRRQLTVLRDVAKDASELETARQADAAAAQSAEWSGTRVIHYIRDGLYRLLLADPAPGKIGLNSLAEIPNRIRLISASNGDDIAASIYADCKAGLRPTAFCPSGNTAETLIASYAPSYEAGIGDFGFGTVQELTFTSAPTDFEGFLVVLPDANTGSAGQVLGFVSRVYYGGSEGPVNPPLNYDGTDVDFWSRASSIVVSAQRRRMTEQVFGLRPLDKAQRSCATFAPTSLPLDYCIQGMQRDMFVPLANELTSQGDQTEDSWKHYLSVAEQAAAKADELGRELIEVGERNDERKEAAAEAVGELCGEYPTVAAIDVSQGETKPPTSDPEIAECVGEKTVALVFLGDDPFAKLTDSDADSAIFEQFCDASGKGAEFAPAAFCSTASRPFTHAGLGFRTPIAPITSSNSPDCDDLIAAFDPNTAGAKLDKQAFAGIAVRPWAKVARLATIMKLSKLNEFADGEWVFTLAAQPLMASSREAVSRALYGASTSALTTAQTTELDAQKPNVWPWCQEAGGTCSDIGNWIRQVFAAQTSGPLNAGLLARVERTLFTLGALSGGVPAGTIRGFVPAIDRPGPISGAQGFTGTVALPTLYGAGHFANVSGKVQLTAEGFLESPALKNEEISVVGEAIPVPSNFVSVRQGRTLPLWLSTTYDQMTSGNAAHDSFLLLKAENPDLHFPGLGAQGDLFVNPEGDGVSREENLTLWLSTLGQNYDPSCPKGTATAALNSTLSFSRGLMLTQDAGQPLPAGNYASRQICASTATVSPVFITSDPPSGDNRDRELLSYVTVATKSVQGGPVSLGFNIRDVRGPSGSVDCNECPRFAWTRTGGNATSSDGNGNNVINCNQLQHGWETYATGTCEAYKLSTVSWQPNTTVRWVEPRVRPAECPPNERFEMFLEKGAANDCQAMQDVVRALGLACPPPVGDLDLTGGPPVIRSPDDVATLEVWLDRVASVIQRTAEGMYLVNLPRSVVNAAQASQTSQGNVDKGKRGELLLEAGKDLNNIQQGFSNIASEFRKMQSAVAKVRIDLVAVAMSGEAEGLNLALRQIELDRQRLKDEAVAARAPMEAMASMGAGFAGAVSGGGGGAIASAGIHAMELFGVAEDAQTDSIQIKKEQSSVAELAALAALQTDNRVSATMHDLTDTENSTFEALRSDFTQLENGRTDFSVHMNELNRLRSQALIGLAKASQADFVSFDGQTIPVSVNTVQRRQFAVINERYHRALDSAKRAAYLARLAIEERLGTRLNDLNESIGPIEAPSLWVDDLCSVQGVNYDALRNATVGNGTGGTSSTAGGVTTPTVISSGANAFVLTTNGPEVDLIKGFSDQYIGDYVAKLKEFTEFYNVRYPFRESGDTAVVSLREDLGHTEDQCVREARNLLVYSDQLTAVPADQQTFRGGWRLTGCSVGQCLDVRSGLALADSAGQPLAAPGRTGGTNWLVATAEDSVSAGGSGGTSGGGGTGNVDAPSDLAPPETVYQVVSLHGGQRYVLSWWALARAQDGSEYLSTQAPSKFAVTVADSGWNTVAYEKFTPVTGHEFGERSVLDFVAPTDGTYEVGFGIGQSSGPGASVAIANVQLEVASNQAATASAYEQTGADRQILSGSCSFDDPATFRQRFSRRCQGTECWYELDQPLLIDTDLLNQGNSSLVGKLAQGNYNYRTKDVALNAVGTGVLNCSDGKPSCYGSAYVEYELTHQAFNVPIEDYLGEVRCFNFGAGHINGGKALATERYLTLPLSSTDSALVNQSAFLKPEFAGRPLSGAYRLRIKDNPALVWENLEDIQILLNYSYWSRVDRGLGQ